MPQNVDDYAIDLERAPECARRIGLILGLFVQVEHGLVPILSWCAGMPMDQARVSLELQKQNARKMGFLRGMCEGISPEWPRDVAAGKAFAHAAMTANRIRNKYAHASYSLMAEAGGEKLHVAVFSDDLRNAVRIEIATLETLEIEIFFLRSLIVAMHNYVEARAAETPINRQEIEELVATAPQPFLRTP
jgi:hypothetical protein